MKADSSLHKRHAGPLSLLLVLLLAAAAPYFVPADPDSAVFRSGALSAILALAAFFPIRLSLERHSRRELLYGLAFALVFSFCLGLGCELNVYGRLLPSMGSLLRRLAAPVMLALPLGALFSFVFALRVPSGCSHSRMPFIGFFLLFAACYGAILLALYPGVISYDFAHEIDQYRSGVYLAAHPVFHTLLLNGLYRLGESLFGSMTAGAALYSVVQLLLLAAMYAWACVFVQRRVPPLVTGVLAAMFALLPFHGVLAVSTAKDPLFAGLFVILVLQLWEVAENPGAFASSPWRILRFAACCLGLTLLRHNSVFAVVPACLAVVLLARRRGLPAAALALLLCLLIPNGLESAVGAIRISSSELMSIPCQQLMRTAKTGEVSEEEFAEISPWFSDATSRYWPYSADPSKGNLDISRYERSPSEFWSLYFRCAAAHPRVYLEAFLFNTEGLWNPDDTSHAHTLSSEEYDFIYLNTVYPFPEGAYAIEPRCLFPALRDILYRSMHHADHERIPFLSLLFRPSVYTFLLLLTTMLLFLRRQRRLALTLIPLWGLLLSLFFAAGVFVRYAYPIMSAVPVMLALAFFAKPQTEA